MPRKKNYLPLKNPAVFIPATVDTILLVKIGNKWQIGKAVEVSLRDDEELPSGLVITMESKGKEINIVKSGRFIVPRFAAKAIWEAVTEGRLSWKWRSPEEFSAYLGENLKL